MMLCEVCGLNIPSKDSTTPLLQLDTMQEPTTPTAGHSKAPHPSHSWTQQSTDLCCWLALTTEELQAYNSLDRGPQLMLPEVLDSEGF